MSRHHSPELNAIVFQLLAELEGYELQVHRLAREWESTQELVLFGETGRAMDRMRALAGALPQLSVQWVMIMISHTELMHNLWRVSRGEKIDIPAEIKGHLEAVDAMAAKCRRLLTQGGPILH
jgi:hypothetical protein